MLCLFSSVVEAKEPPQSIKVFQDESPAIEGLSVRLSLDKSKESDIKHLYFVLTVVNLFSDEIFLCVTDYESVSFTLEEHTSTVFRIMSSGGATGATFPDNTQLLKRLHAALGTQNNSTITCACCQATIPISISMDRDGGFSEWAGFSGVITIPIQGFFRSSGTEFGESIKVPFVVPIHLKQK